MGEREVARQQKKEGFYIDTASIPEHVQRRLAHATVGLIRRIMADPEKRTELEARVEARKQRELAEQEGASCE